MKHTLPVTVTLFLLFIASQAIGLWIISENMVVSVTPTGQVEVAQRDPWERPDISGVQSVLYILGAVLTGTVLLLLIIHFRKRVLWKAWYFLAVGMAISLSLGVFIPFEVLFTVAGHTLVVPPVMLASLIGFLFAVLKFLKPNIIIHNITEVFIYSGIAVLLVPILDLTWGALLLVAISVYDYIAVFKSRHMVTMARFQSSGSMFAGLSIPYSTESGLPVMGDLRPLDGEGAPPPEGEPDMKTAILGGGDIAFPLIFSGAVMQELVKKRSVALSSALPLALVVSLCAAVALFWLLMAGKKDRFYPAMPFISAGCFLGTALVLLVV